MGVYRSKYHGLILLADDVDIDEGDETELTTQHGEIMRLFSITSVGLFLDELVETSR